MTDEPDRTPFLLMNALRARRQRITAALGARLGVSERTGETLTLAD
jgi:hypothetical protein